MFKLLLFPRNSTKNIGQNLGCSSHIGDVTGVFLYLKSMAQPIDPYIFEPSVSLASVVSLHSCVIFK